MEAIDELTKGNNKLPRSSVPYPPIVAHGSVVNTVTSQEVKSLPLSPPFKICQSISGYGTRSLVPYYVMDFDRKWIELILEGKKRATTRILTPDVPGSEEYLNSIVKKFQTNPSHGLTISAVSDQLDSCSSSDSSTKSPSVVFAPIHIDEISTYTLRDLPLEVAQIENFIDLPSFVNCLREYYPTLQDDTVLHVFYFHLLPDVTPLLK